MQRLLLLICISICHYAQAQNGNVGIGTASPVERLHVAGNIKADTLKPAALKLTDNAAAGKVLTSDAAGNASWQAAVTTTTGSSTVPGNIGYGMWGDCGTNSNISNYQPVTDSANGRQSGNFGSRTCISGNYAIVGARLETVGSNTSQGTATILQNINNAWVPVQKITDADGRTGDRFGYNVCINDSFAIVSATGAMTGSYIGGAVLIYKHVGSNWVQTQRLIDSTGNIYESFGYGIYLSGNTLMVGAPGKNFSSTGREGAVFVYNYNGSTWVFRQMLTDPAAIASGSLGLSVSVSGNYLVAGQPGYNSGQGAACIFVNNNGTWSYLQKISEGASGDNFGNSVSISGNNILVGAPGVDRNSTADVGAAYFYHLNGTTWSLQQYIYDYGQAAASDNFGCSVCLSGNYAIIGCYKLDAPYTANAGGAFIYVRTGVTLQRVQRIVDPAAIESDYGGQDVFLDGTTRNFSIGVSNFNAGAGKVLFGRIN